MKQLSLSNNRSKFKTSGKLPGVLEESRGCTSIQMKQLSLRNNYFEFVLVQCFHLPTEGWILSTLEQTTLSLSLSTRWSLPGPDIVMLFTDWELFQDSMGGGAWPLLVGGVICLVNSINERDLNLLTSWRLKAIPTWKKIANTKKIAHRRIFEEESRSSFKVVETGSVETLRWVDELGWTLWWWCSSSEREDFWA
jgi:hypothetical protein